MTEQAADASPFRRVVFPPIPTGHPMLDTSGFEDVIAEHANRGAFGQLAAAYAPMIVGALSAPLIVQRMISVVPITPELLEEQREMQREMQDAQAGLLRLLNGTATPEERAAAAERRARYLAEQQVKNTEVTAEWTALREQHAGSPAIVAVLDIHRPTVDGGMIECQHPIFGYEADAEDWPCETYLAVRNAP